MGWFFVLAPLAFTLLVGRALWQMLRTGTAPVFTRNYLIKRSEQPVMFWLFVTGSAATTAIAVWIGANAVGDFNLLGLS